jgi:hypothetical protein
LHLENVARQTHPTHGCPEEFRLHGGAALYDGSVGDHKPDSKNVLSEAAGNMVVLPMHIGSHHSADGDILRSGRYGDEPSAWKQQEVELPEVYAGLGTEDAPREIHFQQTVGSRRVANKVFRCGRQRRIAIRPA